MTKIALFLRMARRRVELRRAQVWAIRGAAVAGAATVLAQLLVRASPTTSVLPLLLGTGAVGVVVFAGGWLWSRPSSADVARLADRCLGGRERLATALALEDHDGALIRRQRADAEAWIATADASRVIPQGLPMRTSAVGLVAVVLVAVLAVLPNAGLARVRADQEARVALDAAADEIRAIADEASQPKPGEDPERRQALISDLRRAEEALREAAGTPVAVAALSRAQESLLALGSPGGSGRRSAASAAAAALSQAGPAAPAAAALAGLDTPGSDELQQLAASLSGISSEDRASLAAQLSEAAKTAKSVEAAQQLRQAADRIAAEDDAAARSLLESAVRSEEKTAALEATNALSALADVLPTLSLADQAKVAEALKQAAAGAVSDPRLADALGEAAAALGKGRPGDAKSALLAAGQRAQSLSAESWLDAEVAEASNGVQSVKAALLDRANDCPQDTRAGPTGSTPPSSVAPGRAPAPTSAGSVRERARPQAGSGACTRLEGVGPGQGVPGEGVPGKGEGDGQREGQGKGGEGEGQGQGNGQGQDRGQGQGRSQGQGGRGAGEGGQGGIGPGGSATGNREGGGREGAQGPLGRRPGLANERVYVPGLSGTGRSRDVPGAGAGIGADSVGVPYESVYGQYRDAALSQSDRQLLPEATRQLLKRYFQESDQ